MSSLLFVECIYTREHSSVNAVCNESFFGACTVLTGFTLSIGFLRRQRVASSGSLDTFPHLQLLL